MNKSLSSLSSGNKQSGVVLVTAMMFLFAMTIVILSLMRTGLIEERMAANSRDWNNAFQAAEAALRDAQTEIVNRTRISGMTGFVAGCSSEGLCLPNPCSSTSDCTPIWISLASTDTSWKTGSGSSSPKSLTYGTKTPAAALPGLGAQPRYIVEALSVPPLGSLKPIPGSPNAVLYRVTAVGFGVNTSSRVMLQSTVRQ